jgi:hypothetical protein
VDELPAEVLARSGKLTLAPAWLAFSSWGGGGGAPRRAAAGRAAAGRAAAGRAAAGRAAASRAAGRASADRPPLPTLPPEPPPGMRLGWGSR